MNKVQLTLTKEEVAILSEYGSQFGYSLPKTIRFVISKAAEKFLQEGTLPTFSMSEKTERAGLEAQREHEAGKTREVKNLNEFFDEL